MHLSTPDSGSDRAPKPSRRSAWAFVLACVVLTLLVLALIATNRIRLGVPGEWVWEFLPTERWEEIWSPALALAVFLALAWFINRHVQRAAATRAETVAILVGVFFAHWLMQMNVGYLGKLGLHDFAAITITPWSNGYYADAISTPSVTRLLQRYPDLMPTLQPHSRTHPPGPILFYWSFNAFYERFPSAAEWALSALHGSSFDPAGPVAKVEEVMNYTFTPAQKAGAWTASISLPLAFGLTLFPLYYLARRLAGPLLALWAVFLLAALPSGIFFTPVLDQAYALPTVLAVALFWRGLTTRSLVAVAGAAVVLSACLLMSLSFLAVVGFLIILTACHALLTPPDAPSQRWSWPLKVCGVLVLGLVIPLALFQLLTGFDVPRVFLKLLSIASQSARDQYDRRVAVMTYSKWIWWNLADVVVFVGLPAALLYLKGWFRLARQLLATRAAPPEAIFHIAFLLTLLILNFSGVTLGEVARLWIMYMPFLLLLAAQELVALGLDRSAAFVLLALQFAHAVVFKLSFSWI